MEQTLGKRIVQNRKRLGLTQDQLAEKLGVTAQAVSKWENNQSCPDITMLPKLADIFGITTDVLLGSAPEMPAYEAEVIDDKDEKPILHAQNGNWEVTLDGGKQSALGFALLVLAVGAQLLVAKILKLDIGFWRILWPSALVAFGLSELTKKFSFLSFGSLLFGAYFLLDHWDLLPFHLGGDLVFPVILVLLGLSLLVDVLRKPGKPSFIVHYNGDTENNYQINGECIDYCAKFADTEQFVSIPRLSQGKIKTSFGNYTVDLSGVEEVSDGCSLDVSCSFGELVLLIPRRFQVRQTASTAFAGVEVTGHPNPKTEGTIHMKANVSFGEITITYI